MKQSPMPRRLIPLRLLRLQARANRQYGVSPDAFLRLTPREFGAIQTDALGELKAQEARENRRTARIMAMIANVNRPKYHPGYDENDFLPEAAEAEAKRFLSSFELRAKIQHIHAALKGEPLQN